MVFCPYAAEESTRMLVGLLLRMAVYFCGVTSGYGDRMHYKNAGDAILKALRQNRNYCFVMFLWLITYMQAFTDSPQTLIGLKPVGHWHHQIDSQWRGSEL
jgi:hypothetical protein